MAFAIALQIRRTLRARFLRLDGQVTNNTQGNDTGRCKCHYSVSPGSIKMPSAVRWVLQRLAERVVPMVGAALTSTIETMHALDRADQQDALEEAARGYEAEGKIAIAASLRKQATRLDSVNPAAQAVEVIANLATDDQARLERLPDLSPAKGKRRSRPTRSDDCTAQRAPRKQ